MCNSVSWRNHEKVQQLAHCRLLNDNGVPETQLMQFGSFLSNIFNEFLSSGFLHVFNNKGMANPLKTFWYYLSFPLNDRNTP